MIRKLLFQFIIALLCFSASAQQPGSRVSYTLFNDFETGELYGWETYPYAQDIAFDALYAAARTPTYHNSKYALARPFKAHDTNELYQGFTRRLNLYTTADTRVKAAVYFQSDRNAESLDLSLGTFSGERYFHRINAPEANTWIELDLPLSAFTTKGGQKLQAGEHLQVITLKGSYEVVNYLYTYTILMDDFSINAERDARFVATAPVSTDFDMFDVSVLNKHFFYGDEISLRAVPENKATLNRVRGTLVDSRGKVVKDNISFKRSGNEWVNESIYKLGTGDARGQWEIRLQGESANGDHTNWAFRFLMPGKRVNEHPRLFFSSDELKSRLAGEQSPTAKKILDGALADKHFMDVDVSSINEGVDRTAENLVGGPYAKNTVGFNAYAEWNGPNSRLGRVIEHGSLYYAFTGDKAAGEQAKKALLKLCSFSKWNADWMLERKFWTYYPVGYTIKPVAYGYDMLYDLLSEQERAFVREAIMEKGLKLFQRDMVEMHRMPSSQTNHIAVIVSGFGLAATAIYGDDPSNPSLEPYLSGLMTKAKTFIDRTYYEDGSYGEPKSGYMNMATKDLVEVLAAWERNFGVDYTTTTDLPNYYKYPLQASASNGRLQDFGDGGGPQGGSVAFGPQVHAQWLVHRMKNPYLYHYVKPYWESGKGGYLGYLWFRDDITPVSRETLPESKVFSAQGMVMRSGWDPASTILSTRVGPNSNHYHYDQGSFQVMTNGEALLTDPGVGFGGYYMNLEYLGYHVQSIAHNVMLVDHDPESQAPAHYDNGIRSLRDWPRMIHTFNGQGADAVSSELSTVYKDKLESYTRTLLYTKSGAVFLFDQVKSKTGGHVYDWLFHAPANTDNTFVQTYKDGRMTINRPNARLTMDVLSPDIAASSVRERPGKTYSESFLTLSSLPDLDQANFFAVLLPEAKPASGDYAMAPKTTRLNAPGWVGARIEHAGGSDIGFFRTTSARGSADRSGFTADASRFTVSYDQRGRLIKAYFEGSSLSGEGFSIHSDAPITAAVSLQENGGYLLEVESAKDTRLSFTTASRPSSIEINGRAVRGWSYEGGKVSVALTQGRSNIQVVVK